MRMLNVEIIIRNEQGMPFTMIILNKRAPRGRVISVAVLLLGAKVTGQWLPSLVAQFQPFGEPPPH